MLLKEWSFTEFRDLSPWKAHRETPVSRRSAPRVREDMKLVSTPPSFGHWQSSGWQRKRPVEVTGRLY